MSEFKKGDSVRIRASDKETKIKAVVRGMPYPYMAEDNGVYKDEELELIEPHDLSKGEYTKLTPKVGDKFRVVKKLKRWDGKKIEDTSDLEMREPHGDGKGEWRVTHDSGEKYCLHLDCLTTEYLEPLKDCGCCELTICSECTKQPTPHRLVDLEPVEEESNNTFRGTTCAYTAGVQHGDIIRERVEPYIEKELNKNNKTIMQIPKAIKKLLSKDLQALYKTCRINNDLELTTQGRNEYVQNLFNAKGDHKTAMEEMVADANEEIEAAKD